MNDLNGYPLPKYNKKQEAHIIHWGKIIHEIREDSAADQAASLKLFLKEFNDIDPTVDPPQWLCITNGKKMPICTVAKDTYEEASAWLTGCLNVVKADEVHAYVVDTYLMLKTGIKFEIRKKE